MGLSTQHPPAGPALVIAYDQESVRLKDKLFLQRAEWLRRTGKSPEQFADRLSRICGKPVTAKMVEHWLARHDAGRQFPAAMLNIWRAAVAPREMAESIVAEAAIDAREFEAFHYAE